MRKIIYLMIFTIIILVFFVTLHKVSASNITFPLIGKTIVIDPGHGGADAGAVIIKYQEKNINLHISRLLKNHLENYGATVFMTRDDDYDLSKPNALYRKKSDFDNRISYINNNRPDLYISIHLNIFGNSKYRGPQVFYSSINSQNEFLAKKIQEKLNEFTHTKRKTKIITNTYMYDKLNPNGVLIECGFLSNATDRLNLTNAKYQNDFAQIIAKSLVEYFT